MVCFWFVYKTIRGAASATLPQKHLPWFKTLINCLEMDLQSDDYHIEHDIHQVGNRCVDTSEHTFHNDFKLFAIKTNVYPSQTQLILMFYLYNFLHESFWGCEVLILLPDCCYDAPTLPCFNWDHKWILNLCIWRNYVWSHCARVDSCIRNDCHLLYALWLSSSTA